MDQLTPVIGTRLDSGFPSWCLGFIPCAMLCLGFVMDEATVEHLLCCSTLICRCFRRYALAPYHATRCHTLHLQACERLLHLPYSPFCLLSLLMQRISLYSVMLKHSGRRLRFFSELVIVQSATFEAGNRYTPPAPVGIATDHMTRHAVHPPNNLGTDASYITYRQRISHFFCLNCCCHSNV